MLAWSEDPGRSTGAGAKVLCDMDKPLTLVEVQFLHLLFGFQTHPILIFFLIWGTTSFQGNFI